MASGMPAIWRASRTICSPSTATPSEMARIAEASSALSLPSIALSAASAVFRSARKRSRRSGDSRVSTRRSREWASAAAPAGAGSCASAGAGALAASQTAANSSATARPGRVCRSRAGLWTLGQSACQSAAALRCTGGDDMAVTIYHNPRCSKSRQALQLLRERGIEPEIVDYLKTPPAADEIEAVLSIL